MLPSIVSCVLSHSPVTCLFPRITSLLFSVLPDSGPTTEGLCHSSRVHESYPSGSVSFLQIKPRSVECAVLPAREFLFTTLFKGLPRVQLEYDSNSLIFCYYANSPVSWDFPSFFNCLQRYPSLLQEATVEGEESWVLESVERSVHAIRFYCLDPLWPNAGFSISIIQWMADALSFCLVWWIWRYLGHSKKLWSHSHLLSHGQALRVY